MKEFGPQGTPEQDKLTVQGQKPYAESIGDTMPEGNGGGPENPQENQPQKKEDSAQNDLQPRRPIGDPVPDRSGGEAPSTTESNKQGLLNAWLEDYKRNDIAPTAEDLQTIRSAVNMNIGPSWYRSSTEQQGPITENSDLVHPRREPTQPMPRNVSQFPRAEQSAYFPDRPHSTAKGEINDSGEMEGLEEHQGIKSLDDRYLGDTDWDNDEDYLADGARGDTTVRKSRNTKNMTNKPFDASKVRPVSGGEHDMGGTDTDDESEEERKRREKKKELDDKAAERRANWSTIGTNVSWTRSRAFLPDDMLQNMKEDIYGLNVNSVEALAAEIMDTDQTTDFQIGEKYQLLNEQGEFQPDNFLHWMRTWMMHWHGEDPEGKWDFGKIVGLKRDYNEINLDSLVQRSGRYFRSGREDKQDEHGNGIIYKEMVEQIKRELWLFNSSRTFDIDYKAAMGRDEDCAKTLNQLFFANTFTKSVWAQRSALYWMANMPQKFAEVNSEGGEKQNDGRVGEALVTSYLAYYNLSDAEELKKLFGPETALLNKQKILAAIEEQMTEENVPLRFRGEYISSADMEALTKPEKNVLDFVNIFNQPQKSPRIVKVVRSLIQKELALKYGMGHIEKNERTNEEEIVVDDDISVRYADTFALSMARWTGAAARNDTAAVGFDFWSKLQHTEPYRAKQFSETRIGGGGNPHSVHHLKMLGVDLPTGIQSLGGTTLLEIFSKMYESRNTMGREVSEDAKYRVYERVSSQLVFADNTMRGFTIDHFNRVFSVYSQLMDSESIDFDKFTKFDLIDGLTFDRGQFEKAVKENFFKPMRYAWSTYKGVDFSKKVRALDPETQTYKDVYLAEAMFGREILDVEPFIKKGMEHIKMTDPNWHEKIDWENINSGKNRVFLWHRAALLRLAAEYWSHRDRHNNDTRYDWRYYEKVMMAIDSLPSNLAGDETDMRASRSYGSAFNDEERAWLRKLSKTGRVRLLGEGFRKELLTEGAKGVGNAFVALGKGIAA